MSDHRHVTLGDLHGRTAVVTGANSGIGWQTAASLAGAGMHVVLAARRETSLTEAAERIRVTHPQASVDTAPLDLADLASVRTFAEHNTVHYPALDLLLNNAGVMAIPERRLTTDGFEMHLGTNHLGHFALTGLLLPALLAAPQPRVVTVSALIARRAHLDFDNLDLHVGYSPMRAYARSKLANVAFAVELAHHYAGSALISVPVHPGTAMTGLQRHGGRITRALAGALLEPLIGQSPAEAARPSLFAATNSDIVSDAFYGPKGRGEGRGFPGPVDLPNQAEDPSMRENLWRASEELTGVHFAAPDVPPDGESGPHDA
jgi:NAD(P)-dependent dehydrogenase (short-subunit alcohol dehydrogenase family)